MFLGLQILIPVTFALFLKLKLEIFELVIVFICQDSRRCEEIYDKTSCLSYEISLVLYRMAIWISQVIQCARQLTAYIGLFLYT